MPKDLSDEREQGRIIQLIPDQALPSLNNPLGVRRSLADRTKPIIFESDQELQELWDATVEKDKNYQKALTAISKEERSFSTNLSLKVQIAECAIDNNGRLTFRQRLWVPSAGEACPLRGMITQRTHDSLAVGHAGRDGTLAMVSRQFFWPRMS